jgi:hypothetical protein
MPPCIKCKHRRLFYRYCILCGDDTDINKTFDEGSQKVTLWFCKSCVHLFQKSGNKVKNEKEGENAKEQEYGVSTTKPEEKADDSFTFMKYPERDDSIKEICDVCRLGDTTCEECRNPQPVRAICYLCFRQFLYFCVDRECWKLREKQLDEKMIKILCHFCFPDEKLLERDAKFIVPITKFPTNEQKTICREEVLNWYLFKCAKLNLSAGSSEGASISAANCCEKTADNVANNTSERCGMAKIDQILENADLEESIVVIREDCSSEEGDSEASAGKVRTNNSEDISGNTPQGAAAAIDKVSKKEEMEKSIIKDNAKEITTASNPPQLNTKFKELQLYWELNAAAQDD